MPRTTPQRSPSSSLSQRPVKVSRTYTTEWIECTTSTLNSSMSLGTLVRLSNLTTDIVQTAQSVLGLETCMHLTCTNMPIELIDKALRDAYNSGCQNILALRGDPPVEGGEWTAIEGGFTHAKDLVKYIRENMVIISILVLLHTLKVIQKKLILIY